MILEAIIDAFMWLLEALFPLLDVATPAVPGWAVSALGFMGQVYGILLSFDTWLPIDVAILAVGFILSCWAASMLVLLMRVIASFVTLGGGAT